MSQVSTDPTTAFPFDGDAEAWDVLKYTHGVTRGGVIYPYETDGKETKKQTAAINYLCDEWDYAWMKETPTIVS